MFLQSLMKFHNDSSLKILRKKNVTDTLSFGRSFSRSVGRTDNMKTVYPPTNTVCRDIITLFYFSSKISIVGTQKGA